MTCGIYKLEFSGTEQCYIGQSLNIEKRFKIHLSSLRKGKASKKLKEAYSTYGFPKLMILTECTKEELDQFENETIDVFDSVNKGFNCKYSSGYRMCYHGEDAPGARYLNTKILEVFHLLLDVSLEYTYIAEITETSAAVVAQLANGISHNWISEVYPDEYATLLEYKGKRNVGELNSFSRYSNEQVANIMFYCLENPTIPLTKVSEDLEIEYATIKSVVGGFNHKWLEEKYPLEYIELLKLKDSRRSTSKSAKSMGIIYPSIISPDGIIYNVENVKEFCRVHYLNDGHLGAVLKGKERQHKGWRLSQTVNV